MTRRARICAAAVVAALTTYFTAAHGAAEHGAPPDGSDDHRLSVSQPGIDLPDLSAETLASLLDALPAKWKVITISACYSGGFWPTSARW